MSRERHSRRRGGNSPAAEQQGGSRRGQGGRGRDRRREANSLLPRRSSFKPPKSVQVTAEQIQAEDEAIRAFKSENQPVCPRCGQPVTDLSSAIPDRASGEPMHFDCALGVLGEQERLSDGEKIVYIGQGRFGVLSFENPRDTKHFSIKRIIEWEGKDQRSPWRTQLSGLYSQTK